MDKDIFVSIKDRIDLLPFDPLGEEEEELDSIVASNIHYKDPPQFADHADESLSQTHVEFQYEEQKK